MDVITIVLAVLQVLMGAGHGIHKIKKHHDKKKKHRVEQVIKQTVEVNCDEKEDEEE